MTTPKSRSLRRARGPGLQTVPSGRNRQPLWMVHKTPAEFLSLAQAALRQRTSPTQGPAHQHKPCRKGVEQCPAHPGQGVPLNRMFPKYLDQERGEKIRAWDYKEVPPESTSTCPWSEPGRGQTQGGRKEGKQRVESGAKGRARADHPLSR